MKVNNSSVNIANKIVKKGIDCAKSAPGKLSTLADDTVSFTRKTVSKALTKLSKIVDFCPKNREYKIVSLPKGLDIVDGKLDGKATVPTMAIIDVFSSFGDYKIGKKVKIPHGKIVSKFATAGLDDKVGVLAFDTTPRGKSEWQAMQDALEDLVEIVKKGSDVKALNLSVGVNADYEKISNTVGDIVNKNNVEQFKTKILEKLKKSKIPKDQNTVGMINAINELVDNGVQVFSASGNNNGIGIDLLSLSNAQHIVKANDYSNATQAFSNAAAKGIHNFEMIYDKAGNLTGLTNGTISFDASDIPNMPKPSKLLGKIFQEKNATIKGTSFSCPSALNEYLKQIL